MREDLRERACADLRMQALHVSRDGIVELQLAALAQAHEACGREGLAVGGYAETVAGRELLACIEIGLAECGLGDDLAAVGDRDDATRLLRRLDLECEPVDRVVNC